MSKKIDKEWFNMTDDEIYSALANTQYEAQAPGLSDDERNDIVQLSRAMQNIFHRVIALEEKAKK